MKKCIVCGKECDKLIKGMCNKHYYQYKQYGEVLDTNPRNKRDPNEIIEYEDHAEIVLYNKQCEEINRTLIDLEDVDIVKSYKWGIDGRGYVRGGNSRNIQLHRLIMDCPDDMVVDHINHNQLDNRKSNLRICTKQQNNFNKGLMTNNTSGITGVYWDKSISKWRAEIRYNKIKFSLGIFNNFEDAVQARQEAEIEYFGEYRRNK